MKLTTKLMTACGLACGLASMAQGGTLITISGATLFQSFFQSPASTQDDRLDIDGDGVAFGNDQLAPTFVAPSGPYPATIAPVIGQNQPFWEVIYRSTGSVNGLGELFDWGQTFATNPSATNPTIQSNSSFVALALLNRAQYLPAVSGFTNTGNPGSSPLRTVMTPGPTFLNSVYDLPNTAATGGNRIDIAVMDVPAVWGVRVAGAANPTKLPTQVGYGNNTRNAVDKTTGATLTGSLAENLLQSLTNQFGVTYNFNTSSPDANTIYNTPIAFVAIGALTNYGTGIQQITKSELRWLTGTGRSRAGENLMVCTRDAGSGTRNGFQNSICQDPSWGVGENVGLTSSAAANDLIGPNFIPSNKGGSGAMENVVKASRLGVGYSGAERGVGSGGGAYLSRGQFDVMAVKDDLNGGTEYVRPTIGAVLDNGLIGQTDPSGGTYLHDGYRVGGPETFVTIGNPRSVSVAKGGDGSGVFPMSNVEAAAYLNNITSSIAGFVPPVAPDPRSPVEFLITRFVLLSGTDQTNNPCTWSVNSSFNSGVQEFIRANNTVLSNPAVATFGFNSVNGVVPTRTSGTTYTDSSLNGGTTSYVTQGGALLTAGSDLAGRLNGGGTSRTVANRNQIAGDFNGDGVRNIDDACEMIAAWRQRNGGPVWNAPSRDAGLGNIQPGSDASIELLGDFNGDGNFNADDVRYWADGLAMSNSGACKPGKLNRLAGFTAVDTCFGGNFFGTTLATGAAYQAGNSAADLVGKQIAGVDVIKPRGYAPIASDGRVDAKDIDYVFAQLRILGGSSSAPYTLGSIDWSTDADRANLVDLSADINGDLKIDASDVCKIVRDVLRTNFGDVNLDGVVNAADLAIATANLGQLNLGWAGGDVNGDGIVDANDIAIITGEVQFGCSVTCIADVDDGTGSGTPDGGVTIDDLLYYLAIFEAGSVCADVDDGTGTGTTDGGVTIDDLLYFLFRFEAGC